jgi:hypothetical protein
MGIVGGISTYISALTLRHRRVHGYLVLVMLQLGVGDGADGASLLLGQLWVAGWEDCGDWADDLWSD